MPRSRPIKDNFIKSIAYFKTRAFHFGVAQKISKVFRFYRKLFVVDFDRDFVDSARGGFFLKPLFWKAFRPSEEF